MTEETIRAVMLKATTKAKALTIYIQEELNLDASEATLVLAIALGGSMAAIARAGEEESPSQFALDLSLHNIISSAALGIAEYKGGKHDDRTQSHGAPVR